MVKKLTNENGDVAVIYSPGYGAGWSTWAPTKYKEDVVFDADLAKAILDGNLEEARRIHNERYNEVYGNMEDLKIAWIPKGSIVSISVYDGYESVDWNSLPEDSYVT